MKKHIPNALTCGNLVCGCFGIDFAYHNNLILAAYMIGIAAVFDFFDGFAARLLKVSSPIGKELDSLADVVSFGVLPGIIMLHLLQNVHAGAWAYLAYMIPAFSALRLAKFNIDTRQTTSFIGVPTPANAILIGSLPLVMHRYTLATDLLSWPVLLVVTIVMSLLLVAELPLFALKFKDYSFQNNRIRYIFLITAVGLLVGLQFAGLPLIIICYILFSVVDNLTKKKTEINENV
ncbi:MAG: CDP-diacylglycerol--serine O-phosphatidyltransferase [Flammeovirgaceae bacterium]